MNKRLKNLINLNQNVKIFIPDNSENAKEVEESFKMLSMCFGSANSYQAFSAWLESNSSLMKEKVTVCEGFCKESDLQNSIEAIYDFCLKLKKDMKKESIALEINGIVHFV